MGAIRVSLADGSQSGHGITIMDLNKSKNYKNGQAITQL